MNNRTLRSFLILASIILLGASACTAEETFRRWPDVEYSAEEIIETGSTATYSKIFYAPDKMRLEGNVDGSEKIVIIRRDKFLKWKLLPDEKTYMEQAETQSTESTGGTFDDFIGNIIIRANLGEEAINDIKTTKYQVTIKDPRGDIEGWLWKTESDIIVKTAFNRTLNGTLDTATFELKNIRQEPQEPALFEIPPDYKKIDMPGMSD